MISLLALTILAQPASAQNDSTLITAVRLATEGQRDSARSIVKALLRTASPTDSIYPEILYTAGLISSAPDSARAYFRVVGIEYSQSDWADEAFVRLAQLAFAGGDAGTALRHATRVLSDYPFTELRGEAAYWAGRSELNLGNLAAGCDYLARAATETGEDVELANRISFYLQRCVAVPVQVQDTTQGDTVAAPQPSWFAVQVAALRSASTVDRVMRDLASAGYEPRVTRDADGYLRVRVGRFRDRAAARRLAEEIGRRIGGEPFVVEEP
ncbi:MAG: SPOR domain-containing protein [Gemmatimonadales bacterium]